jgi:hypothetical protein
MALIPACGRWRQEDQDYEGQPDLNSETLSQIKEKCASWCTTVTPIFGKLREEDASLRPALAKSDPVQKKKNRNIKRTVYYKKGGNY